MASDDQQAERRTLKERIEAVDVRLREAGHSEVAELIKDLADLVHLLHTDRDIAMTLLESARRERDEARAAVASRTADVVGWGDTREKAE